MKLAIGFLSTILLCSVVGCRQSYQPTMTVILVDTSASITEEGRRQEFDAVDEVIDHLQRGDLLTVIPITGDAEAESQGHVVRIYVPDSSHRQAYDQDLKKVITEGRAELDHLRSVALASPNRKTDIFGTLCVGYEEFSQSKNYGKQLVVLSDFIEDDGQIDFSTSPALARPEGAQPLALRESKTCTPHTAGVRVYLGLLKSRDYAVLPKSRRENVHAFWHSYFEAYQAKPLLYIDGAAPLSSWLDTSKSDDRELRR